MTEVGVRLSNILFQVVIPTGLVRWPNGLTLDLVMEKLYWVDAKLHVIGCSNFDGSNIRSGSVVTTSSSSTNLTDASLN